MSTFFSIGKNIRVLELRRFVKKGGKLPLARPQRMHTSSRYSVTRTWRMLRDARTAGLVKRRRSIRVLRGSRLWAVLVWEGVPLLRKCCDRSNGGSEPKVTCFLRSGECWLVGRMVGDRVKRFPINRGLYARRSRSRWGSSRPENHNRDCVALHSLRPAPSIA